MKRYIQLSCILIALTAVMGCTSPAGSKSQVNSNSADNASSNSVNNFNSTNNSDSSDNTNSTSVLSAEEAMSRLQGIMSRELEMPLWLSDAELEGDTYVITLFQEISNGSTRAVTEFRVDCNSGAIYEHNLADGKQEQITDYQVPDSYFTYENGVYPSPGKTGPESTSQAQEQNTDYMIIPGQSIGKIALGMTGEEVVKRLGKPTSSDEYDMTYKSPKNYISLSLKENVVKQIEFTSSAFSTAEGINLSNYEDNSDQFNVSEFMWRFLQIRYEFKQGGLAFFSFNADLPDDNTEEYQHYVRGYIYEGNTMYEEPISGGSWKPSDHE